MKHIAYRQIGQFNISLTVEAGYITSLDINTMIGPSESETDVHREAFTQLEQYFNGSRTQFDIPLNPQGTPFQKKVWNELRKIEYGHTKSYEDIAISISQPTAYRAVGMANGKNPIPIIIPCHRVIQKDGKLGGYSGGVKIKEVLLDLEKGNL